MFVFKKNKRQHQAAKIAVAAVAAAFLTLACSAAPHPGTMGGMRSKPSVSVPALEKKVHDLINRERRKEGLVPLQWDGELAGIARSHSRDMAARGYFSHFSPEGHDMTWRYRQAGYECGITLGRTIYTGAENIALNNLYNSVITINGKTSYDWNSMEAIAASTVDGWMKSPGHRKNILTPFWRHEGIGIFIAPDDRVYITQDFC